MALNAKRAAEEAAGTVRWLRPEFQDPARRAAAEVPLPEQAGIVGVETQAEAEARADEVEAVEGNEGAASNGEAAPKPAAAATAQPWPHTLPEQVRAVAQLLSASPAPLPLPSIEASSKGKGPWKKGLPVSSTRLRHWGARGR